jgi:site-specific DNA recombinase
MSTSYSSPPSSLPPGSRVVAYLRDSGGSDQELSISRQITEITRWANEFSITITHFFSDEARSGRSLHKRDQLQNMLDHFRNGAEERGIVVWSYDRFARNAVHSQLCRSEIRSLGYTFHSLTDYIPEGSEGVIFEAFKDYVAEQFSHKLSVNVKSGLRDMLEKYKAMGGFPPRGFMREPIEIGVHRNGKPRIVHKWVPDPDLAPTVRLAFEMRARGATFKQIMDATKLFPSINSYTTFFTNRLYMGVMASGDVVIKNYCEPIVTPELWDKVQEVGHARAKITDENNPRRLASQFLLSGLIFCQHCGSPMNGHVVQPSDGRRRREYYSCARKSRRRDCAAREIPRFALEAEVLKSLETIALDLERLLQFQVRVQEHYQRMFSQTEGERSRLRRELREKTRRIDNLVNAIEDRGHSRSMISALHKVELEQAALKIQVENMEKEMRPPQVFTSLQLSDLADELKSALRGDDLGKKKYAVHMLTSRVIASRTDARVDGVLYYIPNVCVGVGTPAEVLTEGIQFTIPIPKYTKVNHA